MAAGTACVSMRKHMSASLPSLAAYPKAHSLGIASSWPGLLRSSPAPTQRGHPSKHRALEGLGSSVSSFRLLALLAPVHDLRERSDIRNSSFLHF